jgi:hypothetical protein
VSITLTDGLYEQLPSRFYWLFDPRFDFLMPYLTSFLERQGVKNPQPVQVLSYMRLTAWETVCLSADGDGANFSVAEPEELNRRFEQSGSSLYQVGNLKSNPAASR